MKRVTELEVENFQVLRSVKLSLANRVTEITGPNGAGKTSLFQAFYVWLKGKKVAPERPISEGEERCRIRGRLGEMYVTRVLKRRGQDDFTNDILFETADGGPYPGTQKQLDDLIGEHRLDPSEFLRLDKRAKFDALKVLVKGIDFDALAREQLSDYTRRTEVNKLVNDAKAAASLITVPANLPPEEIDLAALTTELDEAGKKNQELEARRSRRALAASNMESMRSHATDLRTRAKEARTHAEDLLRQAESGEQRAAESEKAADELQERLDKAEPLTPPVDTAPIQKRISEAQTTNKLITRATEKARHLSTASKYEEESKQITARMQAREAAKQKAIGEANLPVEGLGFGDGELLYKGKLLDKASTGQQMTVAFGLAIAMNPDLRLVWIRDASLLDDEAIATVYRLSEELECWVLMETVRAIGKDVIILRDGLIVELPERSSPTAEAAA